MQDDLDVVIRIAIRAWEPVHASMARVLGEQVGIRVYPDWVASQTVAVRDACTNPEVLTSVAEKDAAIADFVCVV